MSGRVVPETANRPDWPRLVAQSAKDHEARLKVLEAGGPSVSGGSFTLDDGTASAGGVFTMDDGGA